MDLAVLRTFVTAPCRLLYPGRSAARTLAARRDLADTDTGAAAGPPPLPAQGARSHPTTVGDEPAHRAAPHLDARTGTLGLPHVARAHGWLVRAAVDW